VDRDGSFNFIEHDTENAIFSGLDLSIDSASRTVNAVATAKSIDASRPTRLYAIDAPSSADDLCRRVARYAGQHKVKSFSCLDQYLCVAFAQLTNRESLWDIESSL
jgi:hypothetical protein